MRPSLDERFWAKTAPAESGCVEWKAARGKNPNGTLGYGQFFMGSRHGASRRMHAAHRVAWTLVCGEIPPGMRVLHKCDNQACVNPNHLFLGTQLDNVKDMLSKGRKNTARGERQGSAKLQAEQVSQIRSEYKKNARFPDEGSSLALAQKYGISRGTVSDIATRAWRHIP